MKKVLESKSKIRFQDCDPFNHLNNSKYIDYFINAREDQLLENYNLDVFKHFKTYGKGWVVASNQISYLSSADLMEEVLIESQLINVSDKSITAEMKMWNSNKTKLKSILWVKFVYFDIKQQKSTSHPSDLMELLESIVIPIAENYFEKRCGGIVQEIQNNYAK